MSMIEYLQRLSPSYYLASLVVVIVLLWPRLNSWRLRWKNRRANKRYEQAQRRRWEGHRRD